MTPAASHFETIFPPLVIRASAGTGKTFRLSNRYLGLLAAGESPDKILATTFTRKAAGEIQERVLSRLAAAASDAGACAELAKHLNIPLTPQRVTELLASVTSNLHRLHICTLDAFFMRIAGSFSLELGLPIGWRIMDEQADRRLRNDAIRATLGAEEPQRLIDLIRLLNPGEFRRSVHEQIVGVVNNLLSIFQQQPSPKAWRTLSPPKPLTPPQLAKALESMERLPTAADLRIGKAMAKDLLNATIGDWEAFLDGGLGAKVAAGEAKYYKQDIPPAVMAAYATLVKHATAVLLTRLAQRTAATHDLLHAFDKHYRHRKFLARSLKFEDVTLGLAGGAIAGRLDEIYYRLDGRIAHLLLDEFQDTNLSQWQVLKPIAAEIVAVGGESRSFFCVGDVKQAIYGWRGGMAEIFNTLRTEWPHLEPEPMDKTFRCRPAVVDVVNRVFSALPANNALREHTAAATQWAAAFTTHEAERKDVPGYVRMLSAPTAEDGEKQLPVTLRAAAKLVQQIVKQCPDRSVGVLVRTNAAVARLIYELRRPGIDIIASEEGGNPLTDSAPVSVVLSLLRVADHPGDTGSRYHVARSPLGPIVGLTDFKDDALALRIGAEVRRSVIAGGYGPYLFAIVEKLAASCDRRGLNRLLQLVDLAHRYEPDATLRPGDFVRYVETKVVPDPTASPVRVMTVHQSKGLEFDIVVLPELEGLLARVSGETVLCDRPDPVAAPVAVVGYANAAERELDPRLGEMYEQARSARVRETLSVLYVAMTRAVYAVHILLAPSKPNERTIPQTCAGILRCALAEGRPVEPRKILYEHVDPRWYEKAKPPEVTQVEAEPAVAAVRVAEGEPGRARLLEQRSPSGLEGGERVDLSKRLSLAASGARRRGSAIHKLFQRVMWLDEGDIDWAEMREAIADEPEAETYLKQFRAMIEKPAVRAALSRASYPAGVEVAVLRERPFAVREEDAVVSGIFDRVVVVGGIGKPQSAEIIDFKTDGDEGRVEFYRPQMEQYRSAASQVLGIDAAKITAKLVMVSMDRVVPV